MLSFNTEQEARSEAMNVVNTRSPSTLSLVIGQMRFFEITVSESDEPPDDCKEQPRQDESEPEC